MGRLSIVWAEIKFLMESAWADLLDTPFRHIGYSSISTALYIGGFLAGMLILKWLLPRALYLIFGRNRKQYSQKVSGHLISGEFKKGFLAGVIFFLPRLALVLPLGAVLFALAEPFLPITRDEKKYVETRVRIDFRDVSGSMAYPMPGSNSEKSRAEIAMDAHLEFLKMREGKQDRSSLWLFSNNPYMIQPFTIDEELYYQQVFDAPWEMGSIPTSNFADEFWKRYVIPKSRYSYALGEGGTVMGPALRAAYKQFEEDDEKQGRSGAYKVVGRAILIISDAEISDNDLAEYYIKELRKKKVIVYLIWIGKMVGGNEEDSQNPAPFLGAIQRNGGKFFIVSSSDGVRNAYREIDKMEKVKIELEKKIYKTPLFYKFIFISIISLMLIIPLGLFLQLWEHP